MPFLLRIPSLYLVDGIKKINSSSITHELMLLLQGKSHKSTTKTIEFFESLDRKLCIRLQTIIAQAIFIIGSI